MVCNRVSTHRTESKCVEFGARLSPRNSEPMKLRPVTSSDIPLLQYWDSQPHVIEASGDDMPWDWGQELATDPDWRDLVIAEVADKPIGVMQIIDPAEEETHYWGDVAAGLRAIDIWIGEEAYIGRGFGAQMMGLALQMCFDEYGADAVLIDPFGGHTRTPILRAFGISTN